MDPTGRISLLRSLDDLNSFSLNSISRILDISPSNVYFDGNSDFYIPFKIKNSIDQIHTDFPSWGHRKITKQLQKEDFKITEYKTKVFMKEMGLHINFQDNNSADQAILQETSTYKVISPSLDALYPNHIWYIAVTYIRLKYDSAYLVVIMDCYSLFIIDWYLSDMLDVNIIINLLEKSFLINLPNILKSDFSTPFNDSKYVNFTSNHNVMVRMNLSGKWCDNEIEQWFRNLKRVNIYTNEYINLEDAFAGIEDYIHTYNLTPLLVKNLCSPKSLYNE